MCGVMFGGTTPLSLIGVGYLVLGFPVLVFALAFALVAGFRFAGCLVAMMFSP